MRTYFVYILASHSRTLYIGVTSDVERRVYQHKLKLIPGFTTRYNVNQLVHIEDYYDINEAIAREKQLKRWSRNKKMQLIERDNPGWHDLSAGWYPEEQSVRLP
jgi:putative endonuclease